MISLNIITSVGKAPLPSSVSARIRRKSRYVSVGVYPTHCYQVFVEFGGPPTTPINLTEQHMKTLGEHLPKLCEAMCRGESYTCRDGVFRLQCSGTCSVARMYQDKRFIVLKLDELRYLMNMQHLVLVQQTKYILARRWRS
jgi:hypothetical protein